MNKCCLLLMSAFRHCWHCASERGLLDEQDIELLEYVEDNGCSVGPSYGDDQHQHGPVQQRRHKCRLLLLPVAAVVLPSVIGACTVDFTKIFLLRHLFCVAVALCVLLPVLGLLLLLTMPRLFCWLWTRHVDDRFRHFVLALRRRELALFGLRHFSPPAFSSAVHHLPFRAQRVQCLHQLCHFVRSFNTASARLVLTSNERDSLLFNFVGDEMRTLCGDADRPSESVADDNDLQINSLKSLWQYHFLVRSEFIRCALLALRRDICRLNFLAFCHHMALILNTVRTTTASLSVCHGFTGSSRTKQTMQMDGTTTVANGHLAAVSQASICCAQLEWALEKLPLSARGAGADSAWPPPLDVVKCVEQVAVSMRHALTECRQQQQQLPSLSDGAAASSPAALDGGRLAAHQCQTAECQEDEDDDYQIFELDIAQSLATTDKSGDTGGRTGKRQRQTDDDDGEGEGDKLFVGATGVLLAHDAMMRELGAALTLRKEQCLRRERHALARARGVPDEAVPADELDRTPFGVAGGGSVAAATAPCRRASDMAAATTRDADVAVTPPNQAVQMPSAEAVAAQRAAILGVGTAEQQQHEMEQFGDDEFGQDGVE